MSEPDERIDVLDRNLRLLLTRAWEPGVPSAAFRARLEERLERRLSERRAADGRTGGSSRPIAGAPLDARRARPRLRATIAFAAAAAVLALAWLGWRSLHADPARDDAPLVVDLPDSPTELDPTAPDESPVEAPEPRRVAASETDVPDSVAAPDAPAPVEPEVTAPPTAASLGALELLVTDGSGGAPVADYALWLRREVALPEVAEAQRHAVRAADGRARLAGLAPGDYLLCLEAPGRAPLRLARQPVAAGETLRLELAVEPGGAIAGFVVDRETGAPIEGALVIVETDQPHAILPTHRIEEELDPLPLASARTDAAGAFTIAHVSPGSHLLRASSAEHAPSWSVPIEVAAGRTAEPPPLELGRGATLVGRVERADGAPWPAAHVIASHMVMDRASAAMSYGHGVTDEDGEYAIEHLPPGFYVVLQVVVGPGQDHRVASESGSATDALPLRMRQVPLRDGGRGRADFLAEEPGGRFSGRIRDPRGRALGGLRLSLTPLSNSDASQGWTAVVADERGAFEFTELDPGRYGLYVGLDFRDDMWIVDELEIAPGQVVRRDVELTSTDLGGEVLADPGTGPVPLADARLIFLREDESGLSYGGRTRCDSDGRYHLEGLLPGRYRGIVFDPEGRFAQTFSEPFELTLGVPQQWTPVLAPGATLQLAVLDANGRGLSGAIVEIFDDEGRMARRTDSMQTSEDGRLTLGGLAPGDWTVRVHAPGHLPLETRVALAVRGTSEYVLRPEAR